MINQAEYRSRDTEIRKAELVLLPTPSEQAHFGEGGEVFASAMAWSGRGAWWTSRWMGFRVGSACC